MNFSVKTNFPESEEFDWNEKVQKNSKVGRVEVSFFSPELFLRNVRMDDVLEPFQSGSIEASSVHMAHTNITDFPLFELILDKTVQIAKRLNCKDIIIHPSKGTIDEVSGFITNTVDKILSKEKVYLCWETFTSKKRFLSGISGVSDFCHGRQWHKACYDFSHMHIDQEKTLKQISKYLDSIRIFHISNRIVDKELQHLPVFHQGAGDLDLDFLEILKFLKEKKYTGNIVLEYFPEYSEQLAEDALFLKHKFQ
jgi:sugar phosphate isomerase/epimerase